MGQCRATPQALGSRYKLVETLPVGVALSYYELVSYQVDR